VAVCDVGGQGSDYEWEREGEEVLYAIMNAADMPEEAARDIQQILEEKFSDYDAAVEGLETEFSSDSYYEEKGTNDAFWQEEWCNIRARPKNAGAILQSIGSAAFGVDL
jgi:hypothetical protein